MVLLWAILLTSARDEDNLWLKEPVLTLSEDQVLGEFQELVLTGEQGMAHATH